MKKYLFVVIPVLITAGIVVVVATRPAPDISVMQQAPVVASPKPQEAVQDTTPPATQADAVADASPAVTQPVAAGRYETYDNGLIDDAGYTMTVLFFYAAWCPECRAYDQAIKAGDLPNGVQILKVTYDDAQDLRQQYGVTIQSTFVRVNAGGVKQTLWNGYGKDKSIEAIIENTK